MSKSIPTLNYRGYQASSPTSLLSHWLGSYDGEHPLLDIGCAFGINTFKALEKGIPTVAIDPEFRHLDILRSRAAKEHSHLLTCAVGALPGNIPYPDNFFSGILCSEVMHFLHGYDVEKAFRGMYRKLVPGGMLFMSMMSYRYLIQIDPKREKKFQKDLTTGVKWPGVMYLDDDFLSKFENLISEDEVRLSLRQQFPISSLIHFFTKEQLVEELKRSGFSVKLADYGEHPGHIDARGMGKIPGIELLIIAEKI